MRDGPERAGKTRCVLDLGEEAAGEDVEERGLSWKGIGARGHDCGLWGAPVAPSPQTTTWGAVNKRAGDADEARQVPFAGSGEGVSGAAAGQKRDTHGARAAEGGRAGRRAAERHWIRISGTLQAT